MFVYFAEIDTSNVVQRVVVTDSKHKLDEEDDTVSEELGKKYCSSQFGDISPNTWVRTYRKGSPPTRQRFASVGGTYDSTNDIFLEPKQATSWVYDSSNKSWKAPITQPTLSSDDITAGYRYVWNESAYQGDNTKGWDKVKQSNP